MTGRPVTRLDPPAPGEVITSEFLREQARRVDRNTGAIMAPRDVTDQDDVETGVTFTEISRTTSTVTVGSVDIDRIDSVTLENTDTGERMTLVFDND